MTSVATAPVSAEDRARTLLENIRRTPMVRGGRLLERRRLLKAHIETAMTNQGARQGLHSNLSSSARRDNWVMARCGTRWANGCAKRWLDSDSNSH